MGRSRSCGGGLRGGDRDLRSAAGVYGHAAAAVMMWLDDNVEAIILAGVMGICWLMMA
jgi:hypothetical protein